MAKILAPYSLCPLIEHKNFLGVSDDALNDCVIVTLSRNMVIRFRLSDQKQLSSWSTRYKLTAPVVYDFFNNRFIGVFNCDEVSFWHDSLEQLNKLKKHKFTWLIHSVVSSKQLPPHIVYMNGSVTPLNVDRESRKDPVGDFLPTTENIDDVKIITIQGHCYICLGTLSQSGERTLYFVPTSDGKEKLTFKLEQKDKELKPLAYTVIESDVSTQLITLWSNGDLNSLELPPEESGLPGRHVGSIDFVNLGSEVTIFPISGEQIAVYGAQPDCEGGIIAIYSVKFGVVETSEKLKVFNNVGKSLARSRELIIPSGANLLVLPYKLFTARLAGLIGSQAQAIETDNHQDLRDEGVAESRISGSLIPSLIESKNEKELLKTLKNYHDIPDESLVRTLGFALSIDTSQVSEKMIQNVLSRSLVGDSLSLSFIRTYIPLNSALTLLKKLTEIPDKPGNKIPIEWACLLLDAHYQQYILSKSSDVVETIKNAYQIVMDQLEYMDELKQLNWELMNLERGKNRLNKPSISSHSYVIETIKLY